MQNALFHLSHLRTTEQASPSQSNCSNDGTFASRLIVYTVFFVLLFLWTSVPLLFGPLSLVYLALCPSYFWTFIIAYQDLRPSLASNTFVFCFFFWKTHTHVHIGRAHETWYCYIVTLTTLGEGC